MTHCRPQRRNTGAVPHSFGGKMATEQPSAGHAGEQAEQMARHVMQPRSAREFAGDIRLEGFERGKSVGDRRRLAEKFRVDAE